MVQEIFMPKLGQTMEEGTLIEWFVKEGDQVKKGDAVFKFESDKAALESESPAAGTILKILAKPGDVIPVAVVMALVGQPGEDISRYAAAAPAANAAAPAPAQAEAAPATGATAPAPAGRQAGERIFASPRARRVATEAGVPLEALTGSGPEGRIVERDVQAYAAAQPKTTPMARKLAAEAGMELAGVAGSGVAGRVVKADVERAAQPAAPAAAPAPLTAGQTIAVVGIRAIIAERMSASHTTAAEVTLTTEADATRLVELRESFKKSPLAGDLVPTYNDLLAMIAGRALREHPNMNARMGDKKIELLTQVNVGVAVDTERGLMVPVIRDVTEKRLGQIAAEFRTLMTRAREAKSLPDDLTGGTFTVTNLGMYEIDAFTPIINLPECAILGVGRIVAKPAVVNGQVAVRQMMALSLTFDHRVNDGAPAARFLQRIKQLIEQPYLLLA